MRSIRAILFDADGVIQHTRREGLSAQLARVLGFVPRDVDAFTRDVFEVERAALGGKADFVQALAPVVERWGARGAARALAAEWWCAIEVDHALLALVARLRQQGLLCALATNQQAYRAAYMQQTLGYAAAFDRAFYSCQLRSMKPEVEYFEAVVSALGLAPDEVLFIDDVEKNVAGARLVGLQAAVFEHPRSDRAVPSMIELLERFSIAIRAPVR